MNPAEDIIQRLIESDDLGADDLGADDLLKDVSPTSVEDVINRLVGLGFKYEYGVWVLLRRETAITVAKSPGDTFQINVYRRSGQKNKDKWTYSHSWQETLSSIEDWMARVKKAVSESQEADNPDSDDLLKDLTYTPSWEDDNAWMSAYLPKYGFTWKETGIREWEKSIGMNRYTVGISTSPGRLVIAHYTKYGTDRWHYQGQTLVLTGYEVLAFLSDRGVIKLRESLDDLGADDVGASIDFNDLVSDDDQFREIYNLVENQILNVGGKVVRTSSHYVHERSTSFSFGDVNWYWPEKVTDAESALVERIETQLNVLEKKIDEQIVGWNRKIYRELEAAYEASISDEAAIESMQANEDRFDEEGDDDPDGVLFDQLSPDAKKRAIDRWRKFEEEGGNNFYSESVIVEWKWLLKNKGFEDVEISWSGFWSQGDGASFTAQSFDIQRYLTGPDPLTFPEEERDQLWESQEDDADDAEMLKDVSNVERIPISHITTLRQYAEYEARVAEFFKKEGINSLSPDCDTEGNPKMVSFSHLSCDVCKRRLGGARTEVSGYNPTTKEVQQYDACDDCIHYVEYGTLDDMTMMDLKDDLIQERHAGAEQERGIWYHGTSSKLLPAILSQGLIPNPKQRSWDKDETSIVQATRQSLPGIYVTNNLMTAVSSAGRVARRDKANYLIVVMELQPRSLMADEDTVNHALKALSSNVSGSAYHHVWPWFMEVYGDQLKDADGYYKKVAEEQKHDWVNRIAKDLLLKFGKDNAHPELEKRLKELLFKEGFRAMLDRIVAYTEGWDLDHYKNQWSQGFGEYGTEPPLPDRKAAEAKWLAFSDALSRTLKDTARPLKMMNWSFNTTGRVMSPVRFNGKNRIVCIIEKTDVRDPEYHSRMLVHYGTPPQKLIDDWTQSIGPLDPAKDIIYASEQPQNNQLPETTAVTESEPDPEFDIKDILGEPPPPELFSVYSSHGKVTARVEDGVPVSVEREDPEDPDGHFLDQIVKFDVDEWGKHYGEIKSDFSVDIIDIGYWLKDGRYEAPDEEWRVQYAQDQHQGNQLPEA